MLRIRVRAPLAALGLAAAASLLAQDIPVPREKVSMSFPADSPVVLSSFDTDQSRATARGAAIVLDLKIALQLRNVSPSRYIHGVTLRVVAQEVAGGKGSVAYPSLHIGPGETFPVRIDMQLLRPTQSAAGPLVEINLDGVLYQDLGFYGPDRLNSRRTMTAWEMESQRDREFFKRVLAQGGQPALRAAVEESLVRQAERPRLDARVLRGPSIASSAPAAAERTAKFAFVTFPDAPVSPVEGWARVTANEAREPRVEVVNRSDRQVKHVELGWLLTDQTGRQYMAASLPASDPGFLLRPGQTARVLQDTALRFSREGRPVNIQGITGFVSQVVFADDKIWVPNRQNLENASLLRVLAPSAEEQRLTDIYRKRGITALMEELKKY